MTKNIIETRSFDINPASRVNKVSQNGEPYMTLQVVDRATDKWGTFRVFGARSVVGFNDAWEEALKTNPKATRMDLPVRVGIYEGKPQFDMLHSDLITFRDRHGNVARAAKAQYVSYDAYMQAKSAKAPVAKTAGGIKHTSSLLPTD